MGRRTGLAAVLLMAVAFSGMPLASADICNGTCDGSDGGRRGGGGSPGGTAPGSFSINNASVTEGEIKESQRGSVGTFKKLVFTVELTGGGAASVKFATQDGTALSSGASCDGTPDYEPKNGTLNFSGPGRKKVRVTVNDDFCFEDTENMFVNLTDPQGATLGDGKGKGTIRDDDGKSL